MHALEPELMEFLDQGCRESPGEKIVLAIPYKGDSFSFRETRYQILNNGKHKKALSNRLRDLYYINLLANAKKQPQLHHSNP